MTTFARLFLLGFCACLVQNQAAFARIPENAPEKSLLYWRYLCEGQVQSESTKNQIRELHCPILGWTVRTQAGDGKVKEILENEAP